jgi:hypothetical protein
MTTSSAAVLSVIAEHVDRYRQEVADLAPGHQQAAQDDVISALYEAERALRTAARLLRRAAKLAG